MVRIRKTTKQIIEEAILIHGDKYGYNNTIYTDCETKIQIFCNIHNEYFELLSYHHLNGVGCKKCSIKSRSNKLLSNIEDFIKKAKKIHGDKYDYSNSIYVNAGTKMKIFCNFHKEYFEQVSSYHLYGNGCTKCGIKSRSNKKTKSTVQFIKEANLVHENLYDYSNTIYVNVMEKIQIFCNKHGIFEQTPHNHLDGSGCPSCINKTEGKIYNILITIYSTIIRQFKNEWCKNQNNNYLPFDFCITEPKIIIELDGIQHFVQVSNWSTPEEQFENDKFKEKCANENGYSIIRIIQEDVWNDKYDWCKELCDTIQEIINNKKVVNRYLCKNGEYDKYI